MLKLISTNTHCGAKSKAIWFRVWKVNTLEINVSLPDRSDVICECACTHPLLSCISAALGGELQDSQECSQPQAQGKNQKHPLEAVWLHS